MRKDKTSNAPDSRFIGEPIIVEFETAPMLEKRPTVPSAIIWREKRYNIVNCLSEWDDFKRRGKMARNMRDAHLESASIKGSWGVGRFYFRIRVMNDKVFDIYYDRAPKNIDNRKGSWHIYREIISSLN